VILEVHWDLIGDGVKLDTPPLDADLSRARDDVRTLDPVEVADSGKRAALSLATGSLRL
jgi:hypothetical protein